MASQTKSAGTFTEGDLWGVGAYHWVDGGNMTTSDNTYAVVTRTGGDYYCYTALLTNFGFTIPAGSVIDKITVKIEGKTNTPLTNRIDWVVLMYGGAHSLMQAMGQYAVDVAPDEPLTGSDVIYSFNPYYLGDPNFWGNSWTVAQVNDTTFGCGFDCRIDARTENISIDHVQITIDYTEGVVPTDVCDSLPCGLGFQSDEEAIKSIIATMLTGDLEGCAGIKLALELKDCATLTELKDCGTHYTLMEAFKAALKQDDCGNPVLRAFVLPPEEWLPQ